MYHEAKRLEQYIPLQKRMVNGYMMGGIGQGGLLTVRLTKRYGRTGGTAFTLSYMQSDRKV